MADFLIDGVVDRREILRHVGHMNQLAGIRSMEVADGPEKGSRILQVWTGTGLSFDVLADRAMDISSCRYKGIPLSWTSPIGDIHPAYYEPQGKGWLRTFQAGLLVTCGLDHFGAPCYEGDEHLGQHGRISCIPARQVNYRTYWEDGLYRLEVSGVVRQTAMFGENLVLRRCISTALGANTIRIEDSVTNEGFDPWPHMILYHMNLGYPLVSEHARIELAADETYARDAVAEAGIKDWMRLQPPTPGYQEQVFRHKPRPDGDGWASLNVVNPRLGLRLRIAFDTSHLPWLHQWKMLGEGTYVLGIEPSNSSAFCGQCQAKEDGTLVYLGPGESHEYRLEIEVLEDDA